MLPCKHINCIMYQKKNNNNKNTSESILLWKSTVNCYLSKPTQGVDKTLGKAL